MTSRFKNVLLASRKKQGGHLCFSSSAPLANNSCYPSSMTAAKRAEWPRKRWKKQLSSRCDIERNFEIVQSNTDGKLNVDQIKFRIQGTFLMK